jgi:hypothetical protein
MYPILLCIILIFLVLIFGYVFVQYNVNKDSIYSTKHTTKSLFIDRRNKYESKACALARETKLAKERALVRERERKEKKDRKNKAHRRDIEHQKEKERNEAEELERQKQLKRDRYCL